MVWKGQLKLEEVDEKHSGSKMRQVVDACAAAGTAVGLGALHAALLRRGARAPSEQRLYAGSRLLPSRQRQHRRQE